MKEKHLKKLYKRIAKEHGVSWEEVQGEMEQALDYSFTQPCPTITNIVAQGKVVKREKVPTIGEFLSYAVKKVQEDTI